MTAPSACGPPGVSLFPHRRVDSGPKRSSILHRFGMDTPETSLSVGARAVLAQGSVAQPQSAGNGAGFGRFRGRRQSLHTATYLMRGG